MKSPEQIMTKGEEDNGEEVWSDQPQRLDS